MRNIDLNSALESIDEDQEIDLQLLSEENTEGNAEPEIMDGAFSEEDAVALEAMASLIDDSHDADQSLGYRIANMCVGVLKQSNGLESFGLDSSFRVRNDSDLETLVDAISVPISSGNEGFWEELFLSRERIAEKRVSEIQGLRDKIESLPSSPASPVFKTASLKKLHFNGSGKIQDVRKGIKNQLEVSQINQKSFQTSIMKAYKDYCVRVVNRYMKEGDNDGINTVIKIADTAAAVLNKNHVSHGARVETAAEKETAKFLLDASKNWAEPLTRLITGGKQERAVCGGKVFVGHYKEALSVGTIIKSLKLKKDTKWSEAKLLRASSVTTPSASELKSLYDDLIKLSISSQVEQDVLDIQIAEMRNIYSTIEKDIDSVGVAKRNKLLKFLSGGEDRDENAAWSAVWSSYPLAELMMDINTHNLRTVEAGIKYIEDAIKAYS